MIRFSNRSISIACRTRDDRSAHTSRSSSLPIFTSLLDQRRPLRLPRPRPRAHRAAPAWKTHSPCRAGPRSPSRRRPRCWSCLAFDPFASMTHTSVQSLNSSERRPAVDDPPPIGDTACSCSPRTHTRRREPCPSDWPTVFQGINPHPSANSGGLKNPGRFRNGLYSTTYSAIRDQPCRVWGLQSVPPIAFRRSPPRESCNEIR